MKRITKKWLLENGVTPNCKEFRAFQKLWPDGADVTLANALRAVDAGIDLDYFGVRLSDRRTSIFRRATDRANDEFNKRGRRAKTTNGKRRVMRRYQRAIAPVLVAVLRGEKPTEAVY